MNSIQPDSIVLGVTISDRTATLLSELRRRSPIRIRFISIPLGQPARTEHGAEECVILISPQEDPQHFDRTVRHELYHVEVRLDGFPLGAGPRPGPPFSISDWMVMVGISVCDAVLHAEIEARMCRDGDDSSGVQLHILARAKQLQASGAVSIRNRWLAPWVIFLLGVVEYAFWWHPDLYASLCRITAATDPLLVTTAITLIRELGQYDLHCPDGALRGMIFLRDYLGLQAILSIVDVRTGRRY